MFVGLLLGTLLISVVVCFLVARVFDRSIRSILVRLVTEELSSAWHRYITFAIYVVGISGGVWVYSLEQYVNPRSSDQPVPELTASRLALEAYRTIIDHTVRHLDECFAKLAEIRALAQRPAEVEVALWFHDAVYEQRSHENEANSAELTVATVRSAGSPRSARNVYPS